MGVKYRQPLITTIKDRCRMCYTCVRECPAKAIRIANGQAEVIAERCIGCGNCVRVCSQKAKSVVSSIAAVIELLKSGEQVAAIIAPSFAAEFGDLDHKQLVGMIRALGFTYVNEVAFGADLVARKTRELLEEAKDRAFITTPCPAVFGYVKRYHPELIDALAPVVSPMVATARVLRKMHGDQLKVVFVGPCLAKKLESYSDEISDEIDEVLTFEELHHLFDTYLSNNGAHKTIIASDFDPPRSHKGSLFPIGRGLLETANIHEDLVSNEVISASGRTNFIDAIMEFSSTKTNAKLLDVLCCDGCIMGSGMTTAAPLFRRRALVSNYTRKIIRERNFEEWVYYMEKFKHIDLSRSFIPNDQRTKTPVETEIQKVLAQMGKTKPEDELNCGACGYDTCREHAIAICNGLAEIEMCLPYSIEQLHKTINELAISNEQLASTREALIQSEKLASMGQLAAGIAHEINNPLGVVLMYAHLLLDELDAQSEIRTDLEMIAQHADRAKKIVAGLLNFARQTKVNLTKVDLRSLIDDAIKAILFPDNITVIAEHHLTDPMVDLDRDQIIQVLTNLFSNSVNAMPNGGQLIVQTEGDAEQVRISVKDTGIGIPESILPKIFEPFFTTKKSGKGTGLGLAITYGIVKMHYGKIDVVSNADPAAGPTGTCFTITLPRSGRKPNGTLAEAADHS
ncbi:MAG: ATP-binding protein [candidate division KSB1 bacterium]|nr:ATP-binding protein [candidate division KSB1 bacterium]